MLDTLTPTIKPTKSTPGREGHGEGVDYRGKSYYYATGRNIPKDKVVSVKWEGFFCGRVHGDVEYLILAFNNGFFVVLDHHFGPGVREVLAKYKGLSRQHSSTGNCPERPEGRRY